MASCAVCDCEITELGSNLCLGFACEKRLCLHCFSSNFGFCPKCKKHDELERDHLKPGAGWHEDEYYNKDYDDDN